MSAEWQSVRVKADQAKQDFRISGSSVTMNAEHDPQNDENRFNGEEYRPAQPRRYSSIIRRRREDSDRDD
jgi:hypothetical protein